MSTIKMALSLLTLLFAYGVVGRMDYEDAVMMENACSHAADRLDSTCDPSATAMHDVQVPDADVAGDAACANRCNDDR